MTGDIGAGGRDRVSGTSREPARHGIRGYAYRHSSCREMHVVAQIGRRRNNQRERARPAARCEAHGQWCHGANVILDLIHATRNQRQWLIGRTRLELEDSLHRARRSRVNGQAVERLRGKGDHAAVMERIDSRREIVWTDIRSRHAQVDHVRATGDTPYNSPYFDSRYSRYGSVDTG